MAAICARLRLRPAEDCCSVDEEEEEEPSAAARVSCTCAPPPDDEEEEECVWGAKDALSEDAPRVRGAYETVASIEDEGDETA